MQIHLATPGGQRQGPFTLEQINRDLAAKKYRDSDYWAWYEGAEAWVPLYAIPGIHESSVPPALATAIAEPESPSSVGAPAIPTPGVEKSEIEGGSQLHSGFPCSALEQIFIFTNGEGPLLMQSPATVAMLQAIIGEDWQAIRDKVPRDVFGRCNIAEGVRKEGKVHSSAWRAMSAIKPALIQQARAGEYHTCVRTFAIETNDVAAVFLFYRKEKK